jgi:hypothetical protein
MEFLETETMTDLIAVPLVSGLEALIEVLMAIGSLEGDH